MGPQSTFQFAPTPSYTLGALGSPPRNHHLRRSLPWRLSRTKHGEGGGEVRADGFHLEASRGSRALGTEVGAGGKAPAVRKLEGFR